MVHAFWCDCWRQAEGEATAFCKWNQAGMSQKNKTHMHTHKKCSTHILSAQTHCYNFNSFTPLNVIFLSQEKELGLWNCSRVNTEEADAMV